MLKRFFPKDAIVRRAFYSLVAFVVCLVIAGGLEVYDKRQHGSPEREQKAVAQAVSQYGLTSQEAANAVKQLGEKGGTTEVVALLDPATGKAVAAWPAEQVGKKPEEMTLASGVKLPPVTAMKYRNRFKLERGGANEEKGISVSATPIYPWSGLDDHEGDQRGGFGGEDRQWGGGERGGHGGERGRGNWGGRGDENRRDGAGQAAAEPPQAILLIAAPRPAVTSLQVAAGLFGALAVVAFGIYWLSVAWSVFADARKRNGNAFAWGVLVLLTNVVGAAVYLVARQQQRFCEACDALVERSFTHCPHCGNGLKRVCGHCGQEMRAGWTHCANCGTPSGATPNSTAE